MYNRRDRDNAEANVPQETILVVEDEENLLRPLRYNLQREGYRVVEAEDGHTALSVAEEASPDLVILDIMLPKLDGFEVCRILRQRTEVPILMLTAKGEEVDRVVGLELGSDDYVTKPFSMRELMARIKAVLRRSRSQGSLGRGGGEKELSSGDLFIDMARHVATKDGAPLGLAPREFDLLSLLVASKGRVLSREEILRRVWGYGYIGDSRTVDVHIRWLRSKIEVDPSAPQRIITVRGVGYRFEA